MKIAEPMLDAPAEIERSDASVDLKELLEAYERSLILAALETVGGRQTSAAALLRILPTTLNEKMKRLGIGRQRLHQPAVASGDQVCASLRWSGMLAPGGTLEIRGLNGPVRIEAWDDDQVEVLASRRGSRGVVAAVEVKIVEHRLGVTVCAVGRGQELSGRLARQLSRGVGSVRVDLLARVPLGVRVVASTMNDDVDVVGLGSRVEASAVNGRVRFLSAEKPGPHPGPKLLTQSEARE